jgi:hypothetical protein
MKRLYYGSINQLGGNPMRSPMRYAVNRAARQMVRNYNRQHRKNIRNTYTNKPQNKPAELTDGEFIFGLTLFSGFVVLLLWAFTY